MDGGQVIIMLVAIAFCIALGLIQMASENEIRNRTIYNISDITPSMLDANINSAPKVIVTIMRLSGYQYDNCSWVFGSVPEALRYSSGRFAKARLDGFHITQNTSRRFEIKAAYDSAGSRRTGKYMGGCVIEPKFD